MSNVHTPVPSTTPAQMSNPSPPNDAESNSTPVETLPVVCFGKDATCKKNRFLHGIMLAAIEKNHPAAAKQALEHGLNILNTFMWSKVGGSWCAEFTYAAWVLHYTVPRTGILQVLIEHGFPINSNCHFAQHIHMVGDVVHFTMLEIAVAIPNETVVKILIAHGADVHQVNLSGEKPVDYAQALGHEDRMSIIALLREAMKLKVVDATVSIDIADSSCRICFGCGSPDDWCQLQCCQQLVHISCVTEWHKRGNGCIFCREPMHSVNKIN